MRKLLILMSVIGCLCAYAQLPNGTYEIPHSHSVDAKGNDITDEFPWNKISITSMNMNFGLGNVGTIMFYYKGGFPQGYYMTDYNYSGSTYIDGEIFYQYSQNNMFIGESYILVNGDGTKALVKESMGGRTNVFKR